MLPDFLAPFLVTVELLCHISAQLQIVISH